MPAQADGDHSPIQWRPRHTRNKRERKSDSMNKRELIDAITSVNRSATRDFLSEFSERDLADYVRQLDSLGLLSPRVVEDNLSQEDGVTNIGVCS